MDADMNVLGGAEWGCSRLATASIVVPAAPGTVELEAPGLWILPDLCKTPRTRFAQALCTALKSAPRTGSTGRIDVLIQKQRPETRKQSYSFDNAILW